jgi:phosphopantetheine adenylyltransferase
LPSLVLRVSAKLEELDHQNINLQTFQKFAEKHQALLYPAFEMQTRIQDHVVGTTFWHVLIENRVRMFQDRYVSVREILERYEERADLNRLTAHHHEETNASRGTEEHHEQQQHGSAALGTADGHESIKSYSRKKSLKSISVSPIVQSLLAEAEEETKPKRQGKGHGLTADGLSSATPPVLQRKPSVIQRRSSNAGATAAAAPAGSSAAKTKFKTAAHAVAISTGSLPLPPPPSLSLPHSPTEKKRKKSEFRH